MHHTPMSRDVVQTSAMRHRTEAELETGLADIRRSPRDAGTLELIVRRPAVGEREVLAEAELDPTVGLVGDSWTSRPNPKTPDGGPHPEKQLTLMNVRVIRLIADEPDWPLAGDQLYVDLELSGDHLPTGARLAIGSAVIVVMEAPHTGCAKFSARFGSDALRWVNSPAGRALNLRGINTRVLEPGVVRPGDAIRKL
jgi:hypothetical protein